MQFGTMNAQLDLQGYVINAIQDALDDVASAYLDNVLIYSDSEDEHVGHVNWIMQYLMKAGLYLKQEKWEFQMETVRYLRLIISQEGISLHQDMVVTIWNCSQEQKTNNGWLNNHFESTTITHPLQVISAVYY